MGKTGLGTSCPTCEPACPAARPVTSEPVHSTQHTLVPSLGSPWLHPTFQASELFERGCYDPSGNDVGGSLSALASTEKPNAKKRVRCFLGRFALA